MSLFGLIVLLLFVSGFSFLIGYRIGIVSGEENNLKNVKK